MRIGKLKVQQLVLWLDVVIKEMIRKSRTIAKQLIEKRVKVNHTIVDSADFQLQAKMI